MARAGSVPRFRGVLGAAAWPANAVARPAGAAVATPRAFVPHFANMWLFRHFQIEQGTIVTTH